MEGTAVVHVLLMKNCTQVENEFIKYTFDIKGSTKNRLESFHNYKNTNCLKCQNIKVLKNSKKFLMFRTDDKKTIMSMLSKDIDFLRKFGLMDYSMFFVVAFRKGHIDSNLDQFDDERGQNNEWMEKGETDIQEDLVNYYKKALKDRETNRKKIADDFMQVISGMDPREYENM